MSTKGNKHWEKNKNKTATKFYSSLMLKEALNTKYNLRIDILILPQVNPIAITRLILSS